MMFMSLMISSLFSMMRRQGAEVGDGGGGSSLVRRGLSRQVIDSLPVKRYEAPHSDVTEDGDVVEDVSLSRENSRDETLQLENADCCPICLVEYEDGVSELRTLPCGHSFDKECIDSWLADHTTCPSCRENIDNAVQSRQEERNLAISEQYESDPRWHFISAFDNTRRRHSYWGGVQSMDGADISSGASTEGENDLHEDDDDDQMDSFGPRLLSIQNFFRRRRHFGVAVPRDEDEAHSNESIELV